MSGVVHFGYKSPELAWKALEVAKAIRLVRQKAFESLYAGAVRRQYFLVFFLYMARAMQTFKKEASMDGGPLGTVWAAAAAKWAYEHYLKAPHS